MVSSTVSAYCPVGKGGSLAKGHFLAPASVFILWCSLTFYEMSFSESSTNVTAYQVTDAPYFMAMAENMRSPCNNSTASGVTDGLNATAFGVTDENRGNIRNSKKKKYILKLAAWNVRTTNDSDSNIRPERVTAIICRELESTGIDICALSEVRRPGSGNVIERSHTIFWSDGEDKTAGVGFAISNRFDIIGPVPINNRLMTARIPLQDNTHLTVISVYAPTMQRSEVEKEMFYEQLGDCITKAKGDSIIVLGDFNARVGKDWQSWPSVIGKHGVGRMNSNGLLLLEFCTRFQLYVMGTMFQLKSYLKNTWQHLRSKHWHQLDHVLADKKARQFINITKINPTADCYTDHKLLLCKCCIVIKKKRKKSRRSPKLDTIMNEERREKLENLLNEQLPDCKESWKI